MSGNTKYKHLHHRCNKNSSPCTRIWEKYGAHFRSGGGWCRLMKQDAVNWPAPVIRVTRWQPRGTSRPGDWSEHRPSRAIFRCNTRVDASVPGTALRVLSPQWGAGIILRRSLPQLREAVQSQTAVTAYSSSKQLPLFGFAGIDKLLFHRPVMRHTPSKHKTFV